jgi:hypothetical protein
MRLAGSLGTSIASIVSVAAVVSIVGVTWCRLRGRNDNSSFRASGKGDSNSLTPMTVSGPRQGRSDDDGRVDSLSRRASPFSGSIDGCRRVRHGRGCHGLWRWFGRIVDRGGGIAGRVDGSGEPGCVVGMAARGGDGGTAGDEFGDGGGCGVGYCCDGGIVGGLVGVAVVGAVSALAIVASISSVMPTVPSIMSSVAVSPGWGGTVMAVVACAVWRLPCPVRWRRRITTVVMSTRRNGDRISHSKRWARGSGHMPC